MNIYVVYDKQTGRIVHTAARYVLGHDEPVAWAEDEILELARAEVGPRLNLAVAKVPDGFDVRDRTIGLEIDPRTGVCQARKVDKRTPRKLERGAARPEARASRLGVRANKARSASVKPARPPKKQVRRSP